MLEKITNIFRSAERVGSQESNKKIHNLNVKLDIKFHNKENFDLRVNGVVTSLNMKKHPYGIDMLVAVEKNLREKFTEIEVMIMLDEVMHLLLKRAGIRKC